MNKKKLIISIIAVVVAAVALFLILTAGYIVPEGHEAVVTRFGKVVQITKDTGLHWKMPAPVDKANLVDRRVRLLKPPALELLTADKRNLLAEIFVVYQIKDSHKYVVGAGSRTVSEAHLVDLALANLGSRVGRKKFEEFLGSNDIIDEIVETVRGSVSDKAKKDLGISVSRIGFRRLTFPEQNKESVINRMKAERQKIARTYKSEGREKSMKIAAETEQERGAIMAEAREKSLKIRAEADAQGAKIYTEAYTEDRELFTFLKNLEANEAILKKKTTLLLPNDKSFLKPLLEGGE